MMKSRMAMIAASLAMAGSATGAMAQYDSYSRHHTYRGNDGRYYSSRNDYYQRCKKSSGTTGTIAGGAGGAVLGNVLGGGTLGTVAGGVGGALLGRHLDKKHDSAQNRRNGC